MAFQKDQMSDSIVNYFEKQLFVLYLVVESNNSFKYSIRSKYCHSTIILSKS